MQELSRRSFSNTNASRRRSGLSAHLETASGRLAVPSYGKTMGVRGTDDYLTARAANPRTGLISPSIVTGHALTPRTPLTPGEALWLYGDHSEHSSRTAKSPGSSPGGPRPVPNRSRWRQDSKGWIMETVDETASPNVNAANSSALRTDYDLGGDRFIIPMPTAKDPQPYTQTLDQEKAVEYCKDRAKRTLQHGSSNGLNGRMLSVGAGPRKFAEATRALKTYNHTLSSVPVSSGKASTRIDATDTIETKAVNGVGDPCTNPSSTPFPPFSQKSYSSGYGNSDNKGSSGPRPLVISRKPVGTPPRRDSDTTVGTDTSVEENEAVEQAETYNRARTNSNTTRFQDLRQLPRVRKVHPQSTEPLPDTIEKRVFTLPGTDTDSSPSPPRPRRSLVSQQPSVRPDVASKESLSGFEAQIVDLAAWFINNFIHTVRNYGAESSGLGIVQAVHTLSDSDMELSKRLVALKTLVSSGVRILVAIGIIIAMARIGKALYQVFEVVFWPVGVILTVVKWFIGQG